MGGIEGALLALYVSHVNSGEKRARAALSSLFEERAREKQLSRVADDLAVARGEKSREQLRDENAHFARLLHEARVKLAWHRVRAFS
jgi:hypothetical protein